MSNRFIGGILGKSQTGPSISRASTGTYFDSAGVLQTAPTNQPRLNYNFVGSAWTQPSVLIEPAATNILTYSEQIDNAAWSKIALGTRTGITANATLAPDGNTTADLVYVYNGITSISGGAYWPYSYTTGVTYTWSCYFKYAGYQYVYMGTDNSNSNCVWFNLSAGTVVTTASGFRGAITNVGNSWYRCAITFTFLSSMSNAGAMMGCANVDGAVVLTQAGTGSTGVYMWGAQLELNYLGATSYISTTSAAVTRAADVVAPQANGVTTLSQVQTLATTDDQYTVQAFTTTGDATWTAPNGVSSVEVLAVAGGGGGGTRNYSGAAGGGGGGAGGLVYNANYPVAPGTTYPITVGAGGAGGTGTSEYGVNGNNSQFGNIVAIGGGGGGAYTKAGLVGGSSGGAGRDVTISGTAGIAGQGNSGGGTSGVGGSNSGGGGGGGGSAGTTGGIPIIANGGSGLYFNISGSSVAYAGGGGGSGEGATVGGAGGVGGGGAGANNNVAGGAGSVNTGGGGGAGGGSGAAAGGLGGSGIVVIRYRRTRPTTAITYTANAAIVTQKFSVSNTWTAPASVTQVEALVVAGGGGGGYGRDVTNTGSYGAGGGGAGGLLYSSAQTVTPGSQYLITVGNGGFGAQGTTAAANQGSNGHGSIFGALGNNLVTNGTFDANVSGWTDPSSGAEGTFTWANGAATLYSSNSADPPPCVYQAITCVVGRTYMVTTTKVGGAATAVTNITTGVSTGGGTGGFGNVIYFGTSSETGTRTGTFVAAQTSYYIFLRINENTANTSVIFDNVGVYDITAGTSLIAYGGGGGGGVSNSGTYQSGLNGGSGGGGGAWNPVTGTPGTGTSGQGNAGGNALVAGESGGGGGGAGGPGISATTARSGGGGPGLPFNITGNTEYYAGGGAAASDLSGTGLGVGGVGGGGQAPGLVGGTLIGGNGAPNTGGGGSGAAGSATGGRGGSGVVVVRYRVPYVATFLDSGSWTCPQGVTTVQALVVAGGGGGGTYANPGGGGGAGGLVYATSIPVTPGITYLVSVGEGGAADEYPNLQKGTNGRNSSFANIIAIGGGVGSTAGYAGNAGGSGGGGNYISASAGGSGTYGQGNSGGQGAGYAGNFYSSGGGGGAGGVGVNGVNSASSGNGGIGLPFTISGTSVYYGGGGGGAKYTAGSAGTGGAGGGGNGGSSTVQGSAGTANTGGGGGGGSNVNAGVGGSGIVIIRWQGNS